MALDDMPDPSSPQFTGWLMRQDAGTQQEVLRYMGMDAASGNPVSAQGAYAPTLTDFAYDAPSMLGGIAPSTSAKGKPNPYNVESQAKYLNYGQDLIGSGGLGSDMLSWMTGPQGQDPSAWTPTQVGKGNPLQFQGMADLASYTTRADGQQGDDWQTYVATRIAAGDNPAQAIAKLKKLVRGTDETGGVSPVSQDFLDSMWSSPNYNQVPGQGAPDVKSDTGFATTYDTKGMQDWADGLFRNVSKDRALQSTAFQDPQTGQYYSGYDLKDTPQMEAARKEGLAFPTTRYSDPEVIGQYSQQAFGMNPQQLMQAETDRDASIGQLAQTAGERGGVSRQADTSADELAHAWNQFSPTKIGTPAQFGAPLSDWMQQAATVPGVADIVGGTRPYSQDSGGKPLLYQGDLGGLTTPDGRDAARSPNGQRMEDVPYAPGAPQAPRGLPGGSAPGTVSRPLTIAELAAAFGNKTPKPGQTAPAVNVEQDGTMQLATMLNMPKFNAPTKMGAGLSGTFGGQPTTKVRAMTAADPVAARKRAMAAQGDVDQANQAYARSFDRNTADLDRLKLRAAMNYLDYSGRRPLNDQLAARSQTLRNLIGA